MWDLEIEYEKLKKIVDVEKMSDEVDVLVDWVDNDINIVCFYLVV